MPILLALVAAGLFVAALATGLRRRWLTVRGLLARRARANLGGPRPYARKAKMSQAEVKQIKQRACLARAAFGLGCGMK